MEIVKIDLSESGFKGASVSFYQEEEKNGKKQMVLHKVYPKNPIHLGLTKLFKDLRVHLLQVFSIVRDKMDMSIVDMYVNQTNVHIVECDGETITLRGTRDVFEDKQLKLNTCKLQDGDGYEDFDKVKEIVDQIKEETEAYLKGAVSIDEVEVALRFMETNNKKAKDVNLDEIKALPPEKLKEWATKVLESGFGSFVYHADEVEIDEKHLDSTLEELKTEFEVKDDAEIIPIDATPLPKKEKKPKKQDKVLVADEKGNLSVAAPQTEDEQEF